MSKNHNLHTAKKAKNDEFYTQLSNIEKELAYYDLKGKKIYSNCDTKDSKFVEYFKDYDHKYTSCDFRSKESIELLKECDVVVTNPPFSLFREYIAQLIEYDKKFLVIGNMNAITYKEIFPLIKDNKLWLGVTSPKSFIQPDESIKKFGNINWFTNIDHKRRNEELLLHAKYNSKDYPKYDNYDAINVDKVKDIPVDYNGIMGVPITFLDKYNPKQFEIISFRKGSDNKDLRYKLDNKIKEPYFRILIKRK